MHITIRSDRHINTNIHIHTSVFLLITFFSHMTVACFINICKPISLVSSSSIIIPHSLSNGVCSAIHCCYPLLYSLIIRYPSD
ncbi:hypothetical protein BDP27DRAFT_1331447 [Rhodocollybia butyracea]|uniref:Uncharacterized protein n=1 Tax=Rhodocollybia butyracea TaxID=206335 RepID=A0A9P5PM19_9AGAR|nr:hypothetical protein BDP27DRAFT_1331447 [Rhodocollybia butyracea]